MEILNFIFYGVLIAWSAASIMKAIDNKDKESGTAWLIVLMLATKIMYML